MKLRPMTMADADKMLEWKNYPETREFAILTHDEIKKEDHYNWLSLNVIFFKVVENHGNAIGAVRIYGGEISIWIDRKYWGLGIASRVLDKVASMGIMAKIVDGNTASLRAFVKSGFLPVGHKDNYYILEKSV